MVEMESFVCCHYLSNLITNIDKHPLPYFSKKLTTVPEKSVHKPIYIANGMQTPPPKIVFSVTEGKCYKRGKVSIGQV